MDSSKYKLQLKIRKRTKPVQRYNIVHNTVFKILELFKQNSLSVTNFDVFNFLKMSRLICISSVTSIWRSLDDQTFLSCFMMFDKQPWIVRHSKLDDYQANSIQVTLYPTWLSIFKKNIVYSTKNENFNPRRKARHN